MTCVEADQVMKLSRAAQSTWAALTVAQRCRAVGRLRRVIANNCESIADTVARDAAKPLLDALAGDVMVALEMMRYYESHAVKVLRPTRAGKPAFLFSGARFESIHEPHGVALIFGPSNYPFQLSMVPLVTALIAGNAVVLKASERTPATAALITKICDEAELPTGLVQVLQGSPEESTALIDASPDIIFFTGSSRNGRAIAQRAAAHLVPVILELGGKDAALVFADCSLDRAIDGITYGAFANAGRVCVGTKRVFVEASIYETFVARLRERMAHLNVGTGVDVDLCPLPEHEARLLREQVAEAIVQGASVEWPPEPTDLGKLPMLLSGVPRHARLASEETFGPVLCVAPFNDEAHALALANDSEFALSGSVWTSDNQRAQRIAKTLSAGSCAVNDVIRVIANPHTSFGGNRMSGYGRYHGPEGLRAFSRTRTIMTANARRKREINWFPFTDATRQQLATLLRFRHAGLGFLPRLLRLWLLAFLCAFACHPAKAQSKPETRVTLDVRLTPDARGNLAYLVFNSPSGFPGETSNAIRHGFIAILQGARQMNVDVTLPPGTYAVSVYEDLNGNGKLDHNLIGIPREPVGASNNPRPRMGPPRFSDCSFRVSDKSEVITISLVRGL